VALARGADDRETTMSGSDQARSTFINLPVKDLVRSAEFFTELGFGFDAQMGDENTQRMIISDAASVMLHVEEYFREFTNGAIPDPSTTREVVIGLSAQTRAEVDDLVQRAVAAGGESPGDAQDDGFMYMRAFRDLDGHQWSLLHFDMS
jgi:predicted lactoylglutathione lyase